MTPNSSPLTPHPSPLTPHIALIGAGYWGKNLVRNFHELGVLKTICDGAQPIREEMSKTYPDVFITANVSDVLTDNDITGVIIAAHNRLTPHGKWGLCPSSAGMAKSWSAWPRKDKRRSLSDISCITMRLSSG